MGEGNNTGGGGVHPGMRTVIECCEDETFREADLTLECIRMYHHY